MSFPFAWFNLYTAGKIQKHSSYVFMNPSRLSCLCWLNSTFYPIYLTSKSKGGSDIIIKNVISPLFFMKSVICWLMSSLSFSAIAKTAYILDIKDLQYWSLNTWLNIFFQLLWYFFFKTFDMLESNLLLPDASFKDCSTGQKCFSISCTIAPNEF